MKIIIPLLIAGVVVVVLFFYGLFGGPTDKNNSSSTDDAAVIDNQDAPNANPKKLSGETTFDALATLGQNLECRISYDDPERTEPVVGTYFVSNGQIRGDFEVPAPELGNEVVSSIIISGGQFYSWSEIDGEAYGIKATISNDEFGKEDMTHQPVPDDASVSYECTEWKNVDESIFVPPADVLFQDMADLFEAGMEYGTVYEAGEF